MTIFLRKYLLLAFTVSIIFTFKIESVHAYYYDSVNHIYKLEQNDTVYGDGTIQFYPKGKTFTEYIEWDDPDYGTGTNTQTDTITSDWMNYSFLDNTDMGGGVTNTTWIQNPNSTPIYINTSSAYNLSVSGTNHGSFSFVMPINQSSNTTIIPGQLQMSFASNTFSFPSIQLDGTAKTVTSPVPAITVKNGTGIQSGWNINVSATPFTEVTPTSGFKTGTTAKTFSNVPFTVKPSSISALDNADLTGVSVATSNLNLLNGDVTISSASKGYGLGKYQILFASNSLSLQIPQTFAYVDSTNYPSTGTPYQSTLTWKIIVAP